MADVVFFLKNIPVGGCFCVFMLLFFEILLDLMHFFAT